MDIRKIHNGFVTYRFSLVLTILVFIALRLPFGGDWLSAPVWGSMLIQIATALFLLYLTQTFGIIRHKTLLPAFLYLLLAGTNPLFFNDLTGSVSALVVVLCMLCLFSSYQNPLSQAHAFNISLLLTLGSFYFFPLFVFFPLFWYGMYCFRCLNFKTFFANLTGIALMYLFLFTYCVYRNDLSIFAGLLPHFKTLVTVQFFVFDTKDWIINGYLAFLFLLSGIMIFMSGVSEKIQALTTLGFLYTFSFVVYALYLVQNQWQQEWLLILFLSLSLLLAHYFTLSRSRWAMWLFLFTIVFFPATYYWDSWIDYLL